MEVEVGGQRLGSGSKIQAEMPHYEMSTQRLNRVRRTSLSAGTLVPVFKMLIQPGDRVKIKINAAIYTPATVGPAYASMKFQIDMFTADLRLYNAYLHNNQVGLGLDMSKVQFPLIRVRAPRNITLAQAQEQIQIHPSSVLAHLGIMGLGHSNSGAAGLMSREFNAYPYVMYCDIFKNYYANKQETNAYIIHTPVPTMNKTVTGVELLHSVGDPSGDIIQKAPDETVPGALIHAEAVLVYTFTGAQPDVNTLMATSGYAAENANAIFASVRVVGNKIIYELPRPQYLNQRIRSWQYTDTGTIPMTKPALHAFPLKSIDTFRDRVFKMAGNSNPLRITNTTVGLEGSLSPYSVILDENTTDHRTSLQYPQEGLFVKTYQSDRYNNWLDAVTVQSTNISSAVSTVSGSFQIASLILQTRMYEMQNAIMTSGGTYDDWQETMYNHKRYASPEIPIYHGGLTKEIEFSEIISNAASETEAGGTQPLGQLAGKGRFGQKHKGGEVEVIAQEAGYIIGIASITPRIDYTQGNDFDVRLRTMNDIHKPILDQIGYEQSNADQNAYWDTEIDNTNQISYSMMGYVPAWLDYKTEVNQAKGNFALINNKMFMVLARRYEINETTGFIKDRTTYIDPSKFNYLFAETQLDAQNYDLQAAFEVTARRKMSNSVMPKLR